MTVIDFHSHILPSIDHGCSGIDECKKQLDIIHSAGTDIAVATPHFYPHVHKVKDLVEKIDQSVSELKRISFDRAPKLCIGAEVLLCEGMESMRDLHSLCIRGTNVLLIELPDHTLRQGHLDTVEALIQNGYTVLLAHIDRYFKICPDDIATLLSIGAYAQINACALSHHSSLKKVKSYLDATDWIWALGSDLHGADAKEYSSFVKAPKILKDHYGTIMQRSMNLLCKADIIEL